MIDLGCKFHIRTFEWVVVAEVDVDGERATLIWRAGRSLNLDVPVHDVVLDEFDYDALNWILTKVAQFLR